MPVYDYECRGCDWAGEILHVRYDDRADQRCPNCRKKLGSPVLVTAPKVGKPGFQMGAVLRNGQHLNGHFGKESKRRKK